MAFFIGIDGSMVEDVLCGFAQELLRAIFVSERSSEVIDICILLFNKFVSLLVEYGS